MCGAYGYSSKDENLGYKRFGVEHNGETLEPHYNIRPGQYNPVVVQHDTRQLAFMQWGLIPHFARDDKMKYKTINARSETVSYLPTYRKPFRTSRCLVPATHFFEWSGEKGHKQPYLFKLRHEEIFSFAGLYDTWLSPETGKEINSYTIITTTPNDTVKSVHDRMPVILSRENEAVWLDVDITEPERLLPLLTPYPANEMVSFAVSTLVNSWKNDSKDVIQPL